MCCEFQPRPYTLAGEHENDLFWGIIGLTAPQNVTVLS